jgi:membrane-bound serine protease (ClpP class)
MIEVILTLFVIGAVLVFFEALLPGAILGIAGGLCLFTAVVITYGAHGAWWGSTALVGALAIVAITLYLEFKLLPKTSLGARFFHKQSNKENATPQASVHVSLVGSEAVAITPLRPSGTVLINGTRHEAWSANGSAEPGERLKVIRADSFKVTVARG